MTQSLTRIKLDWDNFLLNLKITFIEMIVFFITFSGRVFVTVWFVFLAIV